jgi:hypothetical protein
MMNYIQTYIENKLAKSKLTIEGEHSFQEEFKRVTGPRTIYGSVSITVEPNSKFEFISSADWPVENYEEAVLEAILDVFLTESFEPLLGIKVILNSIQWHNIDSSYLGYYLASKKVAEKVMEFKVRGN